MVNRKRNLILMMAILLVLCAAAVIFAGCDFSQVYSVRLLEGNFIDSQDSFRTFKPGFTAQISMPLNYTQKFLGWYEGDNLVSEKNPYIFLVQRDIVLSGKVADRVAYTVTTEGSAFINTNTSNTEITDLEGTQIFINCIEPENKQVDYWLINNNKVYANASFAHVISENAVIKPVFCDLYTITLQDGVINDNAYPGYNGKSVGLFKRGDMVTVSAKTFEGREFLHWVDEDNTVISTTRMFNLAATGTATYKAVYRDLYGVSVTLTGSDLKVDKKFYKPGDKVSVQIPLRQEHNIKELVNAGDAYILVENGKTLLIIDAIDKHHNIEIVIETSA